MAIQVGDRIPSVTLKHITESGAQEISTDAVFGGKKVVLFAVPGAFTPTCSARHLPGFVERADEFLAKGYALACTAVNDPFVMKAWAEQGGAAGKITMLPDGNGAFAKALGLDFDASAFHMGTRSQRYALVAEDGVVRQLWVEKPGAFEVSSADAVLAQL
ncbi:peroxiredoxin [Arenibaculum pallidiluteum]|uniref:peroxiredoxin n=1 Tax=Arenibaculum pallidiluteum TaxID=2812559 RepID=UPI001A976DCF|nr:peroxiredoxin [Arenibaculum pallidiluteum]